MSILSLGSGLLPAQAVVLPAGCSIQVQVQNSARSEGVHTLFTASAIGAFSATADADAGARAVCAPLAMCCSLSQDRDVNAAACVQAADNNELPWETIAAVARQHKLVASFHPKPLPQCLADKHLLKLARTLQ